MVLVERGAEDVDRLRHPWPLPLLLQRKRELGGQEVHDALRCDRACCRLLHIGHILLPVVLLWRPLLLLTP